MNLHARWILALGATLVIACGDKGNGETAGDTTGTTTGTPGTTTDGTTGTPTTTGAESSSEGSSGEPAHSCLVHADAVECALDPLCQWKGVVQFTHSAQGCQGNIDDFCLEKDQAGGASAWYREVGGDPQVVEFSYTPQGLDPEWKPCTCEGPLACLCTSVAEDCPARLDEFCGGISTQMGCDLANIKGNTRCAWLKTSPEGPADGMCADDAEVESCIPAENGGAINCMPPVYPPPCAGLTEEVYWRDNAGVIEIILACGPVPIGFTLCQAEPTPDQPDECTCRCL